MSRLSNCHKPRKRAKKSDIVCFWIFFPSFYFGFLFLSLPIVTPVKKISNIRKSIQIIKKKKYDLVVSVTKSEASPNFNLFKKMGDRLGLFNNIKKTYRRQNNHYYFVVPNFYVAKRKYVLSTNHIFNGKIFPMEIPRKYTFDINDNYDFQILKFLIENKKL